MSNEQTKLEATDGSYPAAAAVYTKLLDLGIPIYTAWVEWASPGPRYREEIEQRRGREAAVYLIIGLIMTGIAVVSSSVIDRQDPRMRDSIWLIIGLVIGVTQACLMILSFHRISQLVNKHREKVHQSVTMKDLKDFQTAVHQATCVFVSLGHDTANLSHLHAIITNRPIIVTEAINRWEAVSADVLRYWAEDGLAKAANTSEEAEKNRKQRNLKPISPCYLNAYAAYQEAITRKPSLANEPAAVVHEYLKEHGAEAKFPESPESFETYVRKAIQYQKETENWKISK